MLEKNIYEKLWKIGICIILFMNLVIIVFLFLDGKDLFTSEVTRNNYLYEDGKIRFINPKQVLSIISDIGLLSAFSISIISSLIVLIGRRKSKVLVGGKILLNILLLFVTIITSGLLFLSYEDSSLLASDAEYSPKYYDFSNENRKIVICETSYLLGGWGSVYQIYDDNTAWCIGKFYTDDGYRNNGKYQINWTDDGITVIYDDGSGLGKKHYSEKSFGWVDVE